MKNQEEGLKALMEEISVITGAPEATLSPGAPLGVNRINSLGFVELLLFIRRKWNLDYAAAGLPMTDVESPEALAARIARDAE